jgi:tRNA nucleotidyltransferase/poly(A) polymerase
MEFPISSLKKTFTNSNFDFLKNNTLNTILKIVKGRYVGGVVRDGLLGITTNDIDISSPFLPDELMDILTSNNFHPIGTGIKYGTISVFIKKFKIEITSLRKDVKTYGRRAEVSFGGSWEEDSLRRDFTFNGIYLAYENETIIFYDYHGGIEDLKKGRIEFIGDYRARIQEDYLRIMRFIRFFLRYSKDTNYLPHMEKFFEFIYSMKILSIERIIMEIQGILKCEKSHVGIEIMNILGISKLFFVEDLYIFNFNTYFKNISLENRFFITFHKIQKEVIKKLPLSKYSQLFLQKYNNTDFSVESLALIWHKTKSIDLLKNICEVGEILSLPVSRNTHLLLNENFQKYKENHIWKYSEGPSRGEEELNLKINFLSQLSPMI